MSNKAFAFGCFHFGFRETPPTGFTVRAFMDDVRRALRAMPNADNIQVDCESEFHDKLLSFSGDPPNLTEGDWPFPYLNFGEITFDLLIPLGIQEELMRSPLLLTFTERFRVHIRYQYHLPVAVFELIGPTSDPDPSEAVIIIRRLLEREFERQKESLINFQFMGPSPVHADFYLTATLDDHLSGPWTFDLEVEQTRAYDKYNFFFNESLFPDAEEALDALLQDVLPELDTFYLATQFEREKMNAWEKVQELSWSMIELHRKRGFKAFFAKAFRTSNLVNDAFISLSEFEGNSILKDNILRDDYRSTYSSDATPYLQKLVDRRMEERTTYPTEQFGRLLQLFETRRLSTAELIVILVSAVAGGAFGALITTLLGGS